MELATNADAAAKFVRGIIPSDIEISDEDLKNIDLPSGVPQLPIEKANQTNG